MTTINDGGPAFPQCADRYGNPLWETMGTGTCGMSLRDYFAAAAMAAMIGTYCTTMRGKEDAQSDADADNRSFDRDLAIDMNGITGEPDGANEIANDAFVFADAMLAASPRWRLRGS